MYGAEGQIDTVLPQIGLMANGLLMSKILSGCLVTIPVRLNNEDRSFINATEEINKAIKKTARTITKTKLADKIHSETILHKAHLKCLNEAVASITAVTVWKSKESMNPLGQCLFQERPCIRSTRSTTSDEIQPPFPGYQTLSTNIMARIWNSVPGIKNASSISAAKAISKKWAKSVPR